MDRVEADPEEYYPLELETSCKVGAPILDFDTTSYMEPKSAKRLSRADHFSVASAKMSLEDAGITLEEVEEDRYRPANLDPGRAGVLMGTNFGGLRSLENNFTRFQERGSRGVSAYLVPKIMPNSAAGILSIFFGLEGFSVVSSSACASSTHAIAMAASLLKEDRADMVIAGGTEAVITPFMISAFSRIRAITGRNENPKQASRPFDADRDGFLPGEGAGTLILETLDHARDRDVQPYAELLGSGMTDDAHHVTAPSPDGEGARESMRRALENGDVQPEDIDYINAHGTSTPLNDVMETRAIKDLFGDHAGSLSVSSTKSQVGHLLGGAGVTEAIATIYALTRNVIPPTINYENPDPECDLDYTVNEPRERDVNLALSNSFGFGGHNGTLCFSSWEES